MSKFYLILAIIVSTSLSICSTPIYAINPGDSSLRSLKIKKDGVIYIPITREKVIKINKTFEELDSCRETIKILEEYISNKDTVIRTLKGVITLQEIRAGAWQRKEAEYMESVSIRDEKIKDLSGLAKSLKWKNAKNKIAFYTIVPALSLSLIILPILLKR